MGALKLVIPHRASGRHVGVSISDEWIRLVVLTETPEGIVPLVAAAEATPSGAVRQGSLVDAPAVSRVINHLLSSNELLGAPVGLAVDGEEVIVRILELPVTGTRALYMSVLSEIEDFGLFGANEAAIGYQVVEEFEHEDVINTRVLVAAIQRQMVQAYQTALTRAGALPSTLEAAMLASLRAVQATVADRDESPKLVVRLTPSLTEMAIVAGPKLLFSHGFVSAAADSDAEALEDDFLAVGDSWKSLAEAGIELEDEEGEGSVDVQGRRLQEVVAEAQRSLAFFERRFSGFGVLGTVVVLADSALAERAQQALQAQLPLPVQVAEPLNMLHIPAPSAPEIAPMTQDPGAFAAALGAALSFVGEHSSRFMADLLPRVERRAPPRAAIWTSLGLIGLTVIALVGMTFVGGLRLLSTQRELAKVQRELKAEESKFPGGKEELDRLKKAVDDAQNAVQQADSLRASQRWSKKLEATVAALPRGVYLSRMAVEGAKKVSIEGTASTQNGVSEFARRLVADGAFSRAVVASVERDSAQGQAVKFKLSCEL